MDETGLLPGEKDTQRGRVMEEREGVVTAGYMQVTEGRAEEGPEERR